MKKILFIDDCPIQLFLFEKRFKSMFFSLFKASLVVASSAIEAMDIISQDMDKEIVLAIIDLMMPGIDGIETSNMIHKIRPDIFIILSSSIEINNEMKECFKKKSSIRDYIELPHMTEDVVERVEFSLKL